jgi:hypothetical protein
MSPLNSGQFFWADAKTGKTLWLSEPGRAVDADQDLHDCGQRDMGAAGHLGQPHFRQGRGYARDVYVELEAT